MQILGLPEQAFNTDLLDLGKGKKTPDMSMGWKSRLHDFWDSLYTDAREGQERLHSGACTLRETWYGGC